MKMKFSVSIAIVLFFVIFGCASTSYAQNGQITGGYGKASVKDKEVVKAAKFAILSRNKTERSIITLLSIKKAQVQVVAGLNYELCLRVSVAKGDKKATKQFVKAVVYRNLKNKYSLTSWGISKKSGCD